eukprot:14104427-Ditylum_brightwellii.AAC.1
MVSKGRSLSLQAKGRWPVSTYLGGGACDNTAVLPLSFSLPFGENNGCAQCTLLGQNGPSNEQENPPKTWTQQQLLLGINCQAVA